MAAEKEVTLNQHSIAAHQDKLTELTREKGDLVLRTQSMQKYIDEVRHHLSSSPSVLLLTDDDRPLS